MSTGEDYIGDEKAKQMISQIRQAGGNVSSSAASDINKAASRLEKAAAALEKQLTRQPVPPTIPAKPRIGAGAAQGDW